MASQPHRIMDFGSFWPDFEIPIGIITSISVAPKAARNCKGKSNRCVRFIAAFSMSKRGMLRLLGAQV